MTSDPSPLDTRLPCTIATPSINHIFHHLFTIKVGYTNCPPALLDARTCTLHPTLQAQHLGRCKRWLSSLLPPATEQTVSKLALFPHYTAGTYNCCYRQVPTYRPVQTSPCNLTHATLTHSIVINFTAIVAIATLYHGRSTRPPLRQIFCFTLCANSMAVSFSCKCREIKGIHDTS